MLFMEFAMRPVLTARMQSMRQASLIQKFPVQGQAKLMMLGHLLRAPLSTEQIVHRSLWTSLRPVRRSLACNSAACPAELKLFTGLTNSQHRHASTIANPAEGEEKIKQVLKNSFPKASKIEVEDVSGGCGSMMRIFVEAEEFRGKKLIEQQRMVNEVLQTEIKAMHGLSLHTAVPKQSSSDVK